MSIFNKKKKVKHIELTPTEERRLKILPWNDEECIYKLLEKNDDLGRIVVEESFKQNSIKDLEEFSFEKLIFAIINDSNLYTEDTLYKIYKSFGFVYFDRIKKELFYELDKQIDKINIKNLISRAEWIIKNGTRINLVKYAMSVLGKYSEDTSYIILLGKNEHFSLNAVEILKQKGNQELGLKEIFIHAKGNIKSKILKDLELNSDEDSTWLIEKGINDGVYDSKFVVKCISQGKVAYNIIQDYISDEYINGVTILLYNILKDTEKSIYNIKNGGLIINHYVKHIIFRVINNLSLRAKYLCNIYYIKSFIQDEINKEYLVKNGLPYEDFNLVVSFVDRGLMFPGWKKILVLQLNEKNHESFNYIMDATSILKCNIWVQVYNLCVEINEIRSNLIKYLILYDTNNNQDKILEIILKKSDIVNIKYPKVENGVVLSEECMAIDFFMKRYDKQTNRYLNLIELTATSALPSLIISSAELLKKWNIPLRSYVSIERIESMIKDKNISYTIKKKLMAINDNLILSL